MFPFTNIPILNANAGDIVLGFVELEMPKLTARKKVAR